MEFIEGKIYLNDGGHKCKYVGVIKEYYIFEHLDEEACCYVTLAPGECRYFGLPGDSVFYLFDMPPLRFQEEEE